MAPVQEKYVSSTHDDEQPSNELVLPSSQPSRPAWIPSPHAAAEQAEAVAASPVQDQPASIWQVAEHPSPESVLPSSHPSEPTTWPSPQMEGQGHVATSSVEGQGVPPHLGVVTMVRVRLCEHVRLPLEKMHASKAPVGGGGQKGVARVG